MLEHKSLFYIWLDVSPMETEAIESPAMLVSALAAVGDAKLKAIF